MCASEANLAFEQSLWLLCKMFFITANVVNICFACLLEYFANMQLSVLFPSLFFAYLNFRCSPDYDAGDE